MNQCCKQYEESPKLDMWGIALGVGDDGFPPSKIGATRSVEKSP